MLVKVALSGHREQKDDKKDVSYTVFQVDVLVDGVQHTIYKRYSEFEELHKTLKRIMKVRVFPPKRLMNKGHRFIEERREMLELYMQDALLNRPYPEKLLNFLDIHYADDGLEGAQKRPAKININVPVYPFSSGHNVMDQTQSRHQSSPDIILEGVYRALYN